MNRFRLAAAWASAWFLLTGTALAGMPPGISVDASGFVPSTILPPVLSAQVTTPAVAVRGALDSYATGCYAFYGTMPLFSAYSGPLYTVRRESDSATLTVTSAPGTYSSAVLSQWAAGSDLYVSAIYDLCGNGRTLSQATATAQPRLDLSGQYPSFEFDGVGSYFFDASALSGWLKNAPGASVVALRKLDTANATATLSGTARPMVWASSGTGSTRLAMGIDLNTSSDVVQGRRLDADSLSRAGGFAPDTSWDVEVGRWDYANATVYHNTGLNQESRVFQTAGSVSNTSSSVGVAIGEAPSGGGYFQGKIAAVGLYNAALTEAQSEAASASLATLLPAVTTEKPTLDWGSLAVVGPYTLAPGLTTYTIDAPDGTTPAYTDLESFQYHHHTRVAVFGGRVWVAYSGAAHSEEQSGQITEVNSSADNWSTSTGPVVVVPPQSLPFQLTGNGDVLGSRISYPRSFVTYGGNLYIVSAVDTVTSGAGVSSFQVGSALIAAQCNTNGTIGAPFVISPGAYTALAGVSTIAYNTTLGPALFAAANIYGVWGGSAPGQPPSPWVGWVLQGNNLFDEPNTIQISSDGLSLLRIWRKNSGNQPGWLYLSKSSNGGRTWSSIRRTNIPSAITETAGIALADGRVALVGNPQQQTGAASRDPLYIATFGGTTGKSCGVLAVRQGLSNTPTYPNNAAGGAQYPAIASDGTTLYISYSITKQNIGLTTIPIASLASCS